VRAADTVAALCVTLTGVITIALSRQLPYNAKFGPGAGFLPFWLGVALLILSFFLLWNALKSARSVGPDADQPAPFFDFQPGALGPWLVFFVSTGAVSVLFDHLGFFLSIALFMFVTMRWVANQGWLATVALTIATPILLYIGFVRFLMVPFPLGPGTLF
jgi:hypothetical protein